MMTTPPSSNDTVQLRDTVVYVSRFLPGLCTIHNDSNFPRFQELCTVVVSFVLFLLTTRYQQVTVSVIVLKLNIQLSLSHIKLFLYKMTATYRFKYHIGTQYPGQRLQTSGQMHPYISITFDTHSFENVAVPLTEMGNPSIHKQFCKSVITIL